MSLLRDGVHRTAPLTARFGSARFGAARFGCVYGQEDLQGLTREIKSVGDLTGTGPRYVWTERYPNEAPFSGLQTYGPFDGLGHLEIAGDSDVSEVRSAALYIRGDSTMTYSAGASDANLLITGESFVYGVSEGAMLIAGDSDVMKTP